MASPAGLIRMQVSPPGPVAAVFRGLTPELRRAALERALFAAAAPVQRAVKAAAPLGTEPTRKTRRVRSRFVGSGRRRTRIRLAVPESVAYNYGHLRDNIRRRRERGFTQAVAAITTGRAFWAKFLERGTRRMRPHPFFGAAVVSAQADMVRAFAESFGQSVEQAAIRLSSGLSVANRTRLR